MKSSRKPIAPQPSVTNKTAERRNLVLRHGEERRRRDDEDQQAAHRRCSLLDPVSFGAFLANVRAELVAAQELDELRTDEERDDHRDHRRSEDADHAAGTRVRAAAIASSPIARDALTSTASPGRTTSSSSCRASWTLAAQCPEHAALEVAAGEFADGEELVDTKLRCGLADLPVVHRAGAAELGHVPEDRDAPPFAGTVGEVRQGRAHRDGVRVVGVVDEHSTSGQLSLLPAPAGEVDVDVRRTREAEGVEGGERSRGVLYLVTRGEVEADAGDDGSSVHERWCQARRAL